MNLRTRIQALERRRRDGCSACKGRRVMVTHFDPRGWVPKPPPLLIAPVNGVAHPKPQSPICPGCGRDCSFHIHVRFGTSRANSSAAV